MEVIEVFSMMSLGFGAFCESWRPFMCALVCWWLIVLSLVLWKKMEAYGKMLCKFLMDQLSFNDICLID